MRPLFSKSFAVAFLLLGSVVGSALALRNLPIVTPDFLFGEGSRDPAAIPTPHLASALKFPSDFIRGFLRPWLKDGLAEEIADSRESRTGAADAGTRSTDASGSRSGPFPREWADAKRELHVKWKAMGSPTAAAAIPASLEELQQALISDGSDSGTTGSRRRLREICARGVITACDEFVEFLTGQIDRLQRLIDRATDPIRRAGYIVERSALEAESAPLALNSCINGGASCGIAFEALLDEPTERAELAQLLLAYCRADRHESCVAVEAALTDDFEIAAAADVAQDELASRRIQLVGLGALNCNNGELESCARLLESDFIPDDDPRARSALAVLRQSCEEVKDGEASARPCERLAILFQQKGDGQFAMAFADRACTKGSAAGCLQVAKLERDRSQDLTSVARTLKRYCALLETKTENVVISQPEGPGRTPAQMCRALRSGGVSAGNFWSQFGSTPVVASNGEVMNLDQYLLSQFLY